MMAGTHQLSKRLIIRHVVSFLQRPQRGQVLIASYPKSGSTWLRQITFAILYGELPSDIHTFDRVAAEIGKSANIWTSKIVKTHWAYSNGFDRAKRLYIVRRPEAIFQSYYDYRRNVVGDTYSGFAEFFNSRNGISEYLHNLSSWKRDSGKLLLDYDEVVHDFDTSVSRIAAHIDVNLDHDKLQKIQHATSREAMQERFRVSGFQYDFANTGRSERYALSEEDKALIHDHALAAYEDIVAGTLP